MRFVCILTAFFFSQVTSAQTIFFNHIAQEEGLRNGNVRTIVKDHQGFMWIGTEDGLHRFDGNAMKIYSKAEGDSSGLGSNFILCLYEDSGNNLWVGTLDAGLFMYDRKTDSFRSFDLRLRNESTTRVTIRSLIEGKDNYLYVGTDNLFRAKVAHPDSMHFSKVPFATDSLSVLTRFAAIAHDLDSNLLVSVNSEGLFSYDPKSGKSHPHPIGELDRNIYAVYVDRQRKLIWIGTLKNGLFIYDPLQKRHLQVKAGDDDKTLRSNFISSIAGDAAGNTWIAADNGLSMIPHNVDPFRQLVITTYLPGRADNARIHGSIMKTVYVDDQDKVWAGTIYEGVNMYDKHSMNFGSLNISKDVNSPLSYGNINALESDKLGNLWLGLDGGGLYRFEGNFNSQHYSLEHIDVPENIDKIKALKIEGQNLWIATWGNGLLVLNLKTRTCRRVDITTPGVNMGTEIMSLNTDASGNLWIGTFDRGLFRYRIRDGHTEKVIGVNNSPNIIDRINAIYVDDADNLWIGKDVGGLNHLENGGSTYTGITTSHLKPSTTISCVYRDRSNIFWVGAPNLGLIRYDPSANSTELFNESQGLNNIAIHAIQGDSLGRLWISHNAGISMFDKEKKVFRGFGKGNGITASQFNNNSSVARDNGQLVFGHIHGINFFRPADFRAHDEASPIVFTRFFIDNVEQVAGSGPVKENIVTAAEIRLPHDQNSFSVEFADLSFGFSGQATYSYMLEGFDAGWHPAGNQKLISYTNLEPAVYRLKIRSSIGLDDQSPTIRELKITIVPAWWQTLVFKILVAFILIITAVGLHRIRIGFLMRQKKLLEEKVELRTQKLNETNHQLQVRIDEINAMNVMLQKHQLEIFDKTNEIQAQNEELQSQNEQIVQQQDNLLFAREQLKEINVNLERTVSERTEELKQSINDLNKTVFELDRFVYSASHDLSAPLKSIHGLVELIRLEPDHSKIMEYSDYVKRTVIKLEDVIKSMIDYARNSHVLVKTEDVNLKALIDEVTSELAFWQEASKISFINNVSESSRVLTDKARVKVVLHNLISNGIKYHDRNKGENWIRFDSAMTGNYWELTITDNGIGIRAEYLDKVFNMYFRATESSKGSGLGLFIVKETLRKINGTITVESELGKFTSFVLKVGESQD